MIRQTEIAVRDFRTNELEQRIKQLEEKLASEKCPRRARGRPQLASEFQHVTGTV